MKIFVTGCAGFIGSHLVEKLLSIGHSIIGIDNFDTFYSKETKFSNMSSVLENPNFTFYEVDLVDIESLRRVFNQDIDVVVNLAGKAGVRPSIANPSAYVIGNIVTSQNLLEVMRENNVKKLASASSSSVYGNSNRTPFVENMDVMNPISPYAATKIAAELLNVTYHNLYQFDVVNMRFFTVYGPRQRPDLAIHKFVKRIEDGGKIQMYGDGSTARDYTYVADTVNGITAIVNYLMEHDNVNETLNLGNNHPVKLRELINIVGEVLKKKPTIEQLPMQPGDVDITYADISKAQEMVNYQPIYDLRKGIENFVAWYKNSTDN